MSDRLDDEVVMNYTTLYFNGYIEGNINIYNLTEYIQSGDLIIWNKIHHENSYFNPEYIDYTQYNMIFDRNNNENQLVIYEKK